MPLIPDAPCVQLLGFALQALQAGDWEENVGVDIKVRHFRHRHGGGDERPGLGIQFQSDGPPEEDEPQISNWEKMMQMEIALVADCDFASEVSGDDPTGVGLLNRIVAYALQLLRDPNGPFYPKVHEVVDGTKELDEATSPDKGRLSRAISVLYRVSSADDNQLLG